MVDRVKMTNAGMDATAFEYLLNPCLLGSVLPTLSEQEILSKLKTFLNLLQTEKSKISSFANANAHPGGIVSSVPGPIAIPIPASNEDTEATMLLPSSPTLTPNLTAFRTQSILQLMTLQLACKLNWNLSKLNTSLPLGLQHQLFDSLIAACHVQKILSELNVENAEMIVAKNCMETCTLFALTLFCRWILRMVASLPLPLPVGSKVNIYAALPKASLPVVGNNDQGPLQQWILSQANVALKVLQTLTFQEKDLKEVPSFSTFSLEGTHVKCSTECGWQKVKKNQWLAWSLFDMALYHLCLEDYKSAKSCLDLIKAKGIDKFEDDHDSAILKGMKTSVCQGTHHTPSFQIHSPKDADAISKFVDKKDIPFYWRINYELAARFHQLNKSQDIAAKNAPHRLQACQPFASGMPYSLKEISKKNESKAKLYNALFDEHEGKQKDSTSKNVDLLSSLAEPKTKSLKVKRRIAVSNILREVRNTKITKFCHDFQKQYGESTRCLSDLWLPNHVFFRTYLSALPPGIDGDIASIFLYKTSQLCTINQYDEGKKLLRCVEAIDMEKNRAKQVSPNLRNIQVIFFSWHLEHLLKTNQFIPEDIPAKCRQFIIDLCSFNFELFEEILENCLAVLINKQDWDFIFALQIQSWKLLQVCRLILTIIMGVKNGNTDVKKTAHHLCDILLPMHQQMSGNSGKRPRDSNSSRGLSSIRFFSLIYHPDFVQVLASLYSTLYNDSVEDPSTRIHHDFPPINLTSSQLKQVYGNDFYLSILKKICKQSNQLDSSWVKFKADVYFADGNHSAALKTYLQFMALSSSYFSKYVQSPAEKEEKMYSKMIKCLTELHYHSYAVALSQFLSDVEYSIPFKNLEERKSNDSMDGIYKNIWDVTVLEYAMSMHTKKGEHSRRRKALENIGSLEINTNNNIEILREAATYKRFCFLRLLCQHFL